MAKKGPKTTNSQNAATVDGAENEAPVSVVPADEYDRLVANGLRFDEITVEGTGEEKPAEQENLSATSPKADENLAPVAANEESAERDAETEPVAEDKQKLQKALDAAIRRRNRQKKYYDFVVEKRQAKRLYAARRLLSEANAEVEELERQLASLASSTPVTRVSAPATSASAATPVSASVTTSAKPATKKKKPVSNAPKSLSDYEAKAKSIRESREKAQQSSTEISNKIAELETELNEKITEREKIEATIKERKEIYSEFERKIVKTDGKIKRNELAVGKLAKLPIVSKILERRNKKLKNKKENSGYVLSHTSQEIQEKTREKAVVESEITLVRDKIAKQRAQQAKKEKTIANYDKKLQQTEEKIEEIKHLEEVERAIAAYEASRKEVGSESVFDKAFRLNGKLKAQMDEILKNFVESASKEEARRQEALKKLYGSPEEQQELTRKYVESILSEDAETSVTEGQADDADKATRNAEDARRQAAFDKLYGSPEEQQEFIRKYVESILNEDAETSVTEAPAGDAGKATEISAEGDIPAEKTDLSLEEWQEIWKNDERLFRKVEAITRSIDKDKEPEAYKSNEKIADLLYHIVNQDRIMKGQELGSDIFNKAREERAGDVAKVEKLLDIKLDDPKATVAEEEKPEVKEETPKAEADDSVPVEEVAETPEADEVSTDSVITPARVAAREVPAVESTGTLAAEEPASVAPALTEAEKAFENAKLALLQKQDEKVMHERTKASWEREHEAAKASKGLKARKERARSKAEVLAAQARADRAEDEIYFLNEILEASDAWVAAEKEHGTDDLRSKNAEALYRSRLDNFETYRKATSKSGSTEQIKATENLSPAKPSKVKKVFAGIIGAVAAVGLAVGGLFAAKAIVNGNEQTPPEQTPIVTPEPEPEPEPDDSISTPDSAGDEQLTEEQLSSIQGTMADQNLIDSEKVTTISGLAGFAYRTEDGEQKTDIYIRTEAGTLIKYQSEFTKDEIADLRETGSTNADIANAILKTVNRKQATYYYRADESLAKLNEEAALRADGKLINAGQDAIGDYAVYYSIENTQDLVNANHHGSVDLVAIGDNSIVELDDFATYETKTGSSFSINDGGKEAVLAAVEKKLGGNASTSGFSGQVTIGSRVASAANVASTELSR